MSIIDKYKQAIKDVLYGRTKPAPAPSELPDTDDKLANFWAAAAALDMAGPPLPPVTPSDNGKVLAVENGAWAASEQGKKFLVTLTPTAEDFSGTMDKTPEEIAAAYEAGQEIVFRIYASPTLYYDINVTLSSKAASDDLPIFCGYGILTDMFVVIETKTYGNTYSTAIYSLTPAS